MVVGWKVSAQRLADHFGVDPADLFPADLLAIRCPRVEREIDTPALRALAEIGTPGDPHEIAERFEELTWLDAAVERLLPRTREILRRRFLGDSFSEIGRDLHLSCERIRAIESEATHRLRYQAEQDGFAPPPEKRRRRG